MSNVSRRNEGFPGVVQAAPGVHPGARPVAVLLALALAWGGLLALPALAGEHHAVQEVCNGIDDDNDAAVDEGCDAACDAPRDHDPVVLNHDTPTAGEMAWTGDFLAALWSEDTGAVRLGTFRQDGSVARSPMLLHTEATAETCVLGYDSLHGGDRYLFLAYRDTDRHEPQWFTLERRRASDLALVARQTWDESRTGIDISLLEEVAGVKAMVVAHTWFKTFFGDWYTYLELMRLRNDLSWDLPDWVRIDDWGRYGDVAVSQRSRIVGVTWYHEEWAGPSDQRFARFDKDGNRLGLPVILTDYPGRPYLAWRDDEWGIVVAKERGSCSLFRIAADGTLVEEVPLDPCGHPLGISWTGVEYAMLVDMSGGKELWRYDPATGTLRGPFDLPRVPDDAWSLSWTGNELEVLCEDPETGEGDRLVLSRIDCCDDADGDGYTECREKEDRDEDAHPGAIEACNGLDDDDDGSLDEGCPRDCPAPYARAGESRVTDDPGLSLTGYGTSLAWRNGRWHLAWLDERGGFLGAWYVPFDRDGNPLDAFQSESERAHDDDTLVAVDAWSDHADAWSREPDGGGTPRLCLDRYGGPIHASPLFPERLVIRYQSPLAAAWSGNAHAVMLEDPDGSLALGRYDTGGHRLHPLVEAVDEDAVPLGGPAETALAWNGEGYGFAWTDVRTDEDHPEIWFRPLSPWGFPAGDAVRVVSGLGPAQLESREPSLAWRGDGYAIAWTERTTGKSSAWQVKFALLDREGNVLDPPGVVPVGSGDVDERHPVVAWNGQEFAVAWEEWVHPWESELRVARVLGNGTVTGEVAVLGTAEGPSIRPNLAWNGEEWGVAWTDERDDNDEVYFAPLACCRVGAVPGIVTGLRFKEGTKDRFGWDPAPRADAYDVLRGDLAALVSSGGDFSSAVTDCLANDIEDRSWTDDTPAPVENLFYLVRGVNCLGPGSWDSGGPGQVESRDESIAASSHACP